VTVSIPRMGLSQIVMTGSAARFGQEGRDDRDSSGQRQPGQPQQAITTPMAYLAGGRYPSIHRADGMAMSGATAAIASATPGCR